MDEIVLVSIENIVGKKKEGAGTSTFSFSLNDFKIPLLLESSILWIVWKRVKTDSLGYNPPCIFYYCYILSREILSTRRRDWWKLDTLGFVCRFVIANFYTKSAYLIVLAGPNTSRIKTLARKLFPRRQFLDFSKLKDFADDKFEFDETGTELSQMVENTVGKGEIALYEKFLLFPLCFQKTCTGDTQI